MSLLVAWDNLKETDYDLIRENTQTEVIIPQDEEAKINAAKSATVILGHVSEPMLKEAKHCQWLQIPFAGVEGILAMEWGNPEMILTNGSGIFGPCISEHVLGMILSFNRGLHIARDFQHKKIWQPKFPGGFRELTQSTVGILGYGDLGSEVAKRLVPFGCEIIGFRQNPKGEAGVYQVSELKKFLPKLDYLVCALPHTKETSGFLNLEMMKLLPRHGIIINVGRGSLIPHEDLVEALKTGVIAGAGLDVTDPEPLPTESPLWEMENVILTPHNSGYTPFHKQRALEIFFENWHSFKTKGTPTINVVDPQKGY